MIDTKIVRDIIRAQLETIRVRTSIDISVGELAGNGRLALAVVDECGSLDRRLDDAEVEHVLGNMARNVMQCLALPEDDAGPRDVAPSSTPPDDWAPHLRDLSEHVSRADWHRAMWIMTNLMRQAIVEADARWQSDYDDKATCARHGIEKRRCGCGALCGYITINKTNPPGDRSRVCMRAKGHAGVHSEDSP